MEHDLIARLDAQPDAMVLAGTERLAASHHRNVADLVAHVAVVDGRQLFAPRFSSLFRYCCGTLRLSEGATANLIETARAARRYPLILTLLRDGSINPTTVRVLSSSLTAENHAHLLREAVGRTKVEVQAIAVRLRPAPDVSTSLRRITDTSRHPGQKIRSCSLVRRLRLGHRSSPPADPPPRLRPPARPWSPCRPRATATS
jgi:hypothetical protein